MKAVPFSSIISVVLTPLLVMTPLWAQSQDVTALRGSSAQPDALEIRVFNPDALKAAGANTKQTVTVMVTDSSGAAVSNAAVTCRLPDSGATGQFGDGSHATVTYTDPTGRANLEPIQWGGVPGSVPLRLTATKGTAHTGILLETSLTVPGQPSTPAAAVVAPPVTITPPVQLQPQTIAAAPVVSEPSVSVTKPKAQPGTLAKQNSPVTPASNGLTSASADSTVSVTHTSASDAPHTGSHTKWIVLAVVIAAAGAGGAFAMKGKGGSSSSSSSSSALSIGTPIVSVGSGH